MSHGSPVFSGVLAYVDDIVFLAPSVSSMSKLLSICSVFSSEYNIFFNAEKSKHMNYGNENTCPDIYFQNLIICKVKQFQHLGHTLGDHAQSDGILKCSKRLKAEVNILMTQFGMVIPDKR